MDTNSLIGNTYALTMKDKKVVKYGLKQEILPPLIPTKGKALHLQQIGRGKRIGLSGTILHNKT